MWVSFHLLYHILGRTGVTELNVSNQLSGGEKCCLKTEGKDCQVRFRDALGRWGMIASDSSGAPDSSTAWEDIFLSPALFLFHLQSICRTIQVEKCPLWFQTLQLLPLTMRWGNAHFKWFPIFSSQIACLWFSYRLLFYDSAPYEWLEMNIGLKLTKWVPRIFIFFLGYHFSQSIPEVIKRRQLLEGISLTVIWYNSDWTMRSVCSLDHNTVL